MLLCDMNPTLPDNDQQVNLDFVNSMANNEIYVNLEKSLIEITRIEFQAAELLKLDGHYLREPRSSDDLDGQSSSRCSGLSTPDSCYENDAISEAIKDNKQNNRKKKRESDDDMSIVTMRDRSNSLKSPVEGSLGIDSECKEVTVKRAANGISLSRICQYPRLRAIADELKSSQCYEKLLTLLRLVKYLEEFTLLSTGPEDGGGDLNELTSTMTVDVDKSPKDLLASYCGPPPCSLKTSRNSLLPVEIETLIMKVYGEQCTSS